MGKDLDMGLDGHTPLPWQALAPDDVDVFVPIIGVRLDENGEPLETPTNGLVGGATLFPTEIDAEDYERAKANAAFIVRAANSHYELLSALEAARAQIIACHLTAGLSLDTAIANIDPKVDAAIAKAKTPSRA